MQVSVKGSDLPGEGVHFCFFSCLNSVWSLNVKFGHKAQKWIKFKMICIKKISSIILTVKKGKMCKIVKPNAASTLNMIFSHTVDQFP